MKSSLPEDIYLQITSHTNNGNDLADAGRFAEARKEFQSAWDLLPDPKYHWDAARWILMGLADMSFQLGEYKAAKSTLDEFAKWYPVDDLDENEYIFFLIMNGQVDFELGNKNQALQQFNQLFELAGPDAFQDQKYLQFLFENQDSD